MFFEYLTTNESPSFVNFLGLRTDLGIILGSYTGIRFKYIRVRI